jgi:hypothetical protein
LNTLWPGRAPLAGLARLEWAFTLAFDAPQGQPLTLDDMAQLSPDEWPDLQVDLAPSVQQMLCRFNTVALWRASKDESGFPPARPLNWRRFAWSGVIRTCASIAAWTLPKPVPWQEW